MAAYAADVTQTAPIQADAWVSDSAELLAKLRAGDAGAFEHLVREQSPRLLLVIRRYLPNEADAMDALQDAWLSAYRALPTFAGDSRLTTWLHRIAINAALMKLRTQRRRRESSIAEGQDGVTLDDVKHHASVDWSDAAAHLEDEEARRLVRACIEQLPESFRTVILLRDIEGFDTDATAQLLGLTSGATKAKLHRARQALRDLVEQAMLRRDAGRNAEGKSS